MATTGRELATQGAAGRIDLEDDAPPGAPLDVDGRRFEPKDELHVTLVGPKLGAEL